MKVDLTFKNIIDFMKKDDPSQLQDVDLFFSMVCIFTTSMAAPLSAGLVGGINLLADLLGVKDGISQLSKRILEMVSRKRDEDSLSRMLRMEVVYNLMCYTAFFEAVQRSFPEIVKQAQLKPSEKLSLSKAALERLTLSSNQKIFESPEYLAFELKASRVTLPHPIETFTIQKEKIIRFYEELTKGFIAFIGCLSLWDSINETQRTQIRTIAYTLPTSSLKYFEAQYYVLATKFEEFYVWSNLHEHEETKANLQNLSTYMQKQVELSQLSRQKTDIGFSELSKIIDLIPKRVDAIQADTAIQELENRYRYNVNEPIIKEIGDQADPLTVEYPKKSEIFIPQSFKAIRYDKKNRLEDEATWRNIPPRNDLGTFLLNYLSSPYSYLSPLIVLGHPGSGKSLLTEMLAARLICPFFTPIRVVLRDINAEHEISKQIEEQINTLTGGNLSWATLTKQFQEKPALVLLDGYDELLQASGIVFAAYLQSVHKFQEDQISLGRQPVRVIVTSRITLIDKAVIPSGATIVRLLEFDESQRNAWISVWNSKNERYFQHTGNKPFEIPKRDKKILALAEQPLLLLMLALYDFDNNQLREKKGLDQTVLYHSILRWFIERERRKAPEFLAIPENDQHASIEWELQRLGVAAIGMFNRRSFHITLSQINADLAFFGLEHNKQITSGRALSEADLLIGGFFFIHESKSIYGQENLSESNIDYAFEFLHNTFGEFLTADFILQIIIHEASVIHEFGKSEKLLAELNKKLMTENGLRKEWFANLMYAPLFSRPVILTMMREWLKHRLVQAEFSKEDFLKSLDKIISTQIDRLFTANVLPSMMTQKEQLSFGTLPLIGYMAIYSLNLILLRAIISEDGFTFNEGSLKEYEDGTKAWERMTYLWRSWFSLERLDGLAAIVVTKKEGKKVQVQALKTFGSMSSGDRLNLIFNVSLILADNITAGLSGLLLPDSFSNNIIEQHNLEKRLQTERIDLRLELLIRQLRKFYFERGWEYGHFERLLRESIDALDSQPILSEASIRLLGECIRITVMMRGEAFAESIIIEYLDRLRIDDRKHFVLSVINIAKELNNPDFVQYLYARYFTDNTESELLFGYPLEFVIETVRFARKYREDWLLQKVFLENFKNYPDNFFKELSVPLIIEAIQLAEEFEDEEFLKELFNHLKQVVNELMDQQDPQNYYLDTFPDELMVETLRLARKLNDLEFLHNIYQQTLTRWLEMEHFPVSLGVEIVRITKELFGKKMALDIFNKIFRTRYERGGFLDLGSIKQLAYLALELDNRKVFENIYQKNIPDYLERINPQDISLEHMVEIMRMAREAKDKEFLELFYKQYIKQPKVKLWPIEFAAEIINLAQEFDDRRFVKYVYLDSGKHYFGYVKWFNSEKGYGFILPDQGGQDIFVHSSSIRNRDKKTLENGQRVTFIISKGKNGPEAKDVVPYDQA